MGFWRGLDDALAGMAIGPGGIAKMRDMRAEREQQAAQHQQVQGLLGGIQDPMLKMGLILNPKGTLDAVAKNYEPQKLDQGQLYRPGFGGFGEPQAPPAPQPGPALGQPPAMPSAAPQPRPVPSMNYNPKTGMDGGIPYSVGQNADVTYGQGRPASISEQETQTHNITEETRQQAQMNAQIEQFAKTYGLDAEKLKEAARHNKQTEGIGWKNANRPEGGGGGGAGGSGVSLPPGFRME